MFIFPGKDMFTVASAYIFLGSINYYKDNFENVQRVAIKGQICISVGSINKLLQKDNFENVPSCQNRDLNTEK